MCQVEDAELVERCRQGERAAFEPLVRRYQDRVFNACLRVSGNRAEAEDLTQAAFMKALQAINRFDGRSGFYTWLFRIAINLALSARRKAARRPTVSLDAPAGDCGQGSIGRRLSSGEAGPNRAACDSETHRQVLEALAKLDDDHRAVVVLRDVESFSYDEIAEILNVPAGTVKSRLHRARLALRDTLAPILGVT